uniref:Uncharacterized protein n=1 Tax=Anopheles atroparvus TaxID=41427 RepID=A0A182JLS9_ANOAO
MSTEPGEESSSKSSREPPRKKQRPNTSQPELVAFEKLRFVLGRHYFDVGRRLALETVPRCVRNVTECAQHHANKRSPRTKRVGEMRKTHTLEQISEHRPDQFVEFLYQALMRNELFDSELFLAGMQLILTINRPSTELQADYDVPSIVSGSSDALEKCLERFPPCRWDLRAAYQKIVLGHLDAECFKKNPTKTRQNLCHSSRCPLVARLVWEGDHGNVNLFVKKLFQMFINMIALQYPSGNIAIFSRLINLVAVAVNLSEFQHSDGMLQYPCLKTNSEYFAKQLWKTLETSPYFSVNVCLDAIQRIRTPYLLLSLSEELIRKLHRHNQPTNVRGFFQHLLSRSWEDCCVEKRIEKGSPAQPAELYPILNLKKSRSKSSEINRQEYVDLLFVGFSAYCEMYQIPAYFRAIMVQAAEPDTVQPVVENAALHAVGETPEALERHIREHLPQFPGSTRIVADDVADERMIFQGVCVNGELLLEYREDIKYLMLIEQELKKLNSPEERDLFGKWITFLSDIDPSLKMNAS